MKLSEDFEIVQNNSNSFSLIETYVGKDKSGKKKKIQKRESYYGTLYQTLQGFLEKTAQKELSLGSVRAMILGILIDLDAAKEHIKQEFKTEVREAR